jgi:DHA3 family tetracycline resistance protein-like MFS transporter
LLAGNALLVVSVIGFGLAGHFELALATYWTVRLARSVNDPLYTTWVNQRIDDAQVRATIISTASQTNALGQILGGPIFGAIGNLWSINAAIVAAGAILSPVLILYRLAIRQGRTGSPHLRRAQTPEAVRPEEG